MVLPSRLKIGPDAFQAFAGLENLKKLAILPSELITGSYAELLSQAGISALAAQKNWAERMAELMPQIDTSILRPPDFRVN